MYTTSNRLAGKVVIVTGASKGIGASIARQMGREGAAVVANYASSPEGAGRVVADIVAGGGRAVAVQANVARKADVERMFAEADKAFGRPDVLVNNAGIYEFAPLAEVTEEHFHRQFDINVLGLILASKEAARRFGPTGGSIINISSVVSTVAAPNAVVYSATKAAVDAVTRVLAKELGPRNIRVNAINPGFVETEGNSGPGYDAFRTDVVARTPLGRAGRPQDIAPAAVFLASQESSWVTGETFYITGGLA